MPLSHAGGSIEKTILNLGGDPADPFRVFPDVRKYFDNLLIKKTGEARIRKEEQKNWEKLNPELATKLDTFFSGKSPVIEFAEIIQKEGIATRAASSTVLALFAKKIENMIVASADLSNSDKTDGFLKNTKPFIRHDFTGAFLQIGVSELTMAALANGMALHGGVIPVCGTFFVFSDYMKPAVRLACLMELPVKYVWTHDAFRVGEDGPTHQPVEQEAQIRLMEQLHNHSGKNSCLVLRPADAAETTVAWKMALENVNSPTALLLSRQNIKDLPVQAGSNHYTDALQCSKGAYIVTRISKKPDIVFVGNGSEVSTLVEGARLLKEKNEIEVQVVSAISEGLFRNQDLSYQQKVIPPGVPVLGLTAGLPSTLRGLVGDKGLVIGMESFGFSAPYEVLDEKLGFTPENVYNQALKYLKGYKL